MTPNTSLACGDITKLLKRFQEDLLVEEEYQSFLAHLESCANCKKYVRSIGSLANQLWELGDVKVPSDLVPTVMFKLQHPEKKAHAPKMVIPKKVIIGAVVASLFLPLLVIGIFHAVSFLRERNKIIETDETLTIELSVKEDEEKKSKKKEIMSKIFKDDEIPEEEDEEETDFETSLTIVGDSPEEKKAAPPGIDSLHWHIQLSEEIDTSRHEKSIFRKENTLEQRLSELKELVKTVKGIKEETQEEFRQHYSEKKKNEVLAEEEERDILLEEKLEEKRKLETVIKKIRDEKNQLEIQMREDISGQQRKEAKLRASLINLLNTQDIRPDYNANNILLSVTSGKNSEYLLEQILSISEESSSFRDFTTDIYTHPKGKYRVSLYFEQENANTLHWHIDPAETDKKAALFDTINEFSRSFHYQSDNLVVFSISKEKIEELKRRIKAMRIPFFKYGSLLSDGNEFISGPAIISIYFLN